MTKILHESERLNENKYLEGRPRHCSAVLRFGADDRFGAAACENPNTGTNGFTCASLIRSSGNEWRRDCECNIRSGSCWRNEHYFHFHSHGGTD